MKSGKQISHSVKKLGGPKIEKKNTVTEINSAIKWLRPLKFSLVQFVGRLGYPVEGPKSSRKKGHLKDGIEISTNHIQVSN